MKRLFIVGATMLVALSGCSASMSQSTESNQPPTTGSASHYTIITDWRKLPADNEYAIDIWIRKVKIDDSCFIQSASHHDWSYNLTPTGQPC